MSRIGNKIIELPANVTVTVDGHKVEVKGPLGTLNREFSPLMDIKVEENHVKVSRPNDEKTTKQLHGTTRALLNGMVEGVSKGFKKDLVITGIGYRASKAGNKIILNVGYSHPVEIKEPADVKIEVKSATEISVSGIDKQKVGQLAAEIRAVKEPEPYGGKGIAYSDEHIRRKEGKKAGKK